MSDASKRIDELKELNARIDELTEQIDAKIESLKVDLEAFKSRFKDGLLHDVVQNEDQR